MEQENAFKVGFISLLMFIAIALLLVWKSGIFLRASGYELIGEFQSISGLLNGAEVRYRGYKVGKVASVKPGPENVKAYFWIKSGVSIPEGSTLRVVFDGLVGEKYIDIRPDPESKKMLKSGDSLYGYATSSLADFVDVGTQNLEHTKAILATLRDVLTEDSFSGAMKNMMLSMERMTNDLSRVVKSITDEAQSKSFVRIVNNLEETTASLQKMLLDIQNTVVNPEVLQNVEVTLGNLAGFSGDLKNLLSYDDVNGDSSRVFKKNSPATWIRTLSSLKIKPDIGLQYYKTNKMAYYFTDVDFNFGEYFFRTGIGDRLGSLSMLNFQQGLHLTESLATRFGVFYTKPGLAFDYKAHPRMVFSLEAYDINSLELEFMGRMNLMENLGLIIGVKDDPFNKGSYNNFSVGISYKP
ncbi:MAG: MCE family protein [bacterium]|nr:MCE family protein [bacterium]